LTAVQSSEHASLVADLISKQTSLSDAKRSRNLSTRFDPPLDAARAIEVSEKLVVGMVEEQTIRWGVDADTGYRITVLVSTILTSDGARIQVEQPAGVTEEDGELVLSYGSDGHLLESGKAYAVLVQTSGEADQVIRGHAYEVLEDQTLRGLSKFDGNSTIDGEPVSRIISTYSASKDQQ
jgi:hypothetical protein